jgi:phenylalanyl-tRNA synthetase alpha chain
MPDDRHLPVFHQIEGLVVDRGITFGDLAGTVEAFASAFFGPGMPSRLRPSFFAFTKPSAELEVNPGGWISLGGCGIVDPDLLEAAGIDARAYGGFAFSFGIERLAQVRVGLLDVRSLLDNDVRFLAQF